MNFLLAFLCSFVLSLFFTVIVRKIAHTLSIVDMPNLARKKHDKEIALMGGLAIYLSFFVCLFIFKDCLVAGDLEYHHWVGVFIASSILMFGGILDDKCNLKPKYQIIFPIIAVLALIIAGINIEKISNPFGGGYLYLDILKFDIFSIANVVYGISIISALIIFIWLMGIMYSTKLLDGVDGLVTGVISIGAAIIFLFTISEKYFQSDIAIAAMILFGACLGFLIFNFNPASIFLGEGGSLFLGFALGVLAIISGGKIAIALLVMGIPIMDVVVTIIRRLKNKQNPFRFSGRDHLHFRILDSGLSQKITVLIYYVLSLIFGLSALFLQSKGKLLALIVLVIVMFVIVYIFNKKEK